MQDVELPTKCKYPVIRGDILCRNRKGGSGPFAGTYVVRPALAVAVERINWFCEARSISKLENSSHDALNASAQEKSTKTSAASYGCKLLNRGESIMRILMSPFYYVRTKHAKRRQMKKALQMLSVSGVVRPSYIEPRYFIGATQIVRRHG
jgi:hypothetical protein